MKIKVFLENLIFFPPKTRHNIVDNVEPTTNYFPLQYKATFNSNQTKNK